MSYKTVTELADEKLPRELWKKYDTAMPQPWVNQMIDLGADPRGQMVWLYDSEGAIFGRPYPLTEAAKIMILLYNHVEGCSYPNDWLV